MLANFKLQTASPTNDRRIRSTWAEYRLHTVTFEGQNTVFEPVPGHTGFLVGIGPVDPQMFGKPRLQATSSTKDRRIQSTWAEYRLHIVAFEGQNTVFEPVPGHTGFLAGIGLVDPCMPGKPRLQTASSSKDQRIRSPWAKNRLHTVAFESQNAVFETAPGHTGFLAGI